MKSRSVFRARPDHVAVATEARGRRGVWFLAGVYATVDSASSRARHVPKCKGMPAYAPAGAFEAYHARHDDGYAVWVRYVAGDQPVPELPDRMTVRVCRRESGVGIVTVTVSTRCPVCGGPRGFDAIEEYRFREAGAWFTADDWINRCGHIDNAQAVLRESRERPLPAPGRDLTAIDCPVIPEPPAPDSPAGVVLAAAANWRGMRARAAVKLLDESGFSREAELVRAELLVGDSRGYKSAREVAHWLHTGGAS